MAGREGLGNNLFLLVHGTTFLELVTVAEASLEDGFSVLLI